MAIVHYRLQFYGLVEKKIQGDGNCQFRSLSDQLYRSPEHHNFVREQIVNELAYNREMYEGYVPMAYNDYLKTMKRNGEWGDHVTLLAVADWARYFFQKLICGVNYCHSLECA